MVMTDPDRPDAVIWPQVHYGFLSKRL